GEGLRALLLALGELACAGVPVQTGWLFRGRQQTTPAPDPNRPIWTVDGQLVRDRDGNCLPGGMKPPRPITEPPLTLVRNAGPPQTPTRHRPPRPPQCPPHRVQAHQPRADRLAARCAAALSRRWRTRPVGVAGGRGTPPADEPADGSPAGSDIVHASHGTRQP